MEMLLLRGLLLLSCILLAQSLVCHECTGVSHPRYCAKTTTCNSSEVCFTERILGDNGVVFHNSGCTTKKVCVNGRDCSGHVKCVSFCETFKCNKYTCGNPGLEVYNRSCKEYKEAGHPSGPYMLDLRDGLPPFQVYCDMDTAGGGWTVFQRRKDGSVDFYRDWNDYKEGFGNLQGEFWLGNDHLHRLTKAGLTTLRVDLEDWSNNTAYAQYSRFHVGPASDYYKLNVSGCSGSAGDSLSYHNGMYFSTKDADRDQNSGNCAVSNTGAWWYNNCHYSGLNGMYFAGGKTTYSGVYWYHWKSAYSLKSSEMKLREP